MVGGALGTAIMNGIRCGLFPSEASMGSAPNAATTATTSHPVKEGFFMKRYVIVAIFISLIVIALYGVISALPQKEGVTESVSSQEDTQKNKSISWIASLPQNQTLTHIVLGDSLAKGYGSEKDGYVGIATTHLNKDYHLRFQLKNLAKNGVTSKKLISMIQQDDIKKKISTATLITISIGGNDILKLKKKAGMMEASRLLGNIHKQYTENLTAILSIVREENPDAVIVLSQLYNPLQLDGILVNVADSFINSWNNDISTLAKQFAPIVTIKTNKLLTLDTKSTWAYDEVHPNDVGYELLAEEMIKGLSELKVVEKDGSGI